MVSTRGFQFQSCLHVVSTYFVLLWLFFRALPTTIKHVVFGPFGGEGEVDLPLHIYNGDAPRPILSVSVKLLGQNTASVAHGTTLVVRPIPESRMKTMAAAMNG